MKSKIKSFSEVQILMIISIIMLCIALLDLPYGYYQILRWVISGTTGYLAYLFYGKSDKKWMWIFVVTAILFNPISTIHLSKEVWSIVNIIVVLLLTMNMKNFNKTEKTIEH